MIPPPHHGLCFPYIHREEEDIFPPFLALMAFAAKVVLWLQIQGNHWLPLPR